MSQDFSADYLVDRRSLRRRLTFWRALAFGVAALAILGAGLLAAGPRGGLGGAPHIARVSIEGVITGDAETLRLIREAGQAPSAAAIILSIESPGGTTTGSEKLYDEIRIAAGKKPVVAVVGTLAASGAYIAAIGADQIFARKNSLVGSIGVLFQIPNFARLLDNVGVKVEEVKSSPLKASPNGFEPTSEASRAALAALVADSFDWFKGLVKERRAMSDAELAAVADGRVFTGHQGLPLKLVDQIGGERDAIAWLEKEKGVAKSLPVRDYKAGRGFERLGFLSLAADLVEACGGAGLARTMRSAALNDIGALDGLLAVWHGPSQF